MWCADSTVPGAYLEAFIVRFAPLFHLYLTEYLCSSRRAADVPRSRVPGVCRPANESRAMTRRRLQQTAETRTHYSMVTMDSAKTTLHCLEQKLNVTWENAYLSAGKWWKVDVIWILHKDWITIYRVSTNVLYICVYFVGNAGWMGKLSTKDSAHGVRLSGCWHCQEWAELAGHE